MGYFNTLITEMSCPNCGEKHEARIQFKFGNTLQLHFNIGDPLQWGGNDIGSPDMKKVKLYGVIESTACPFCGQDSFPEEYDIFVQDNIIMSISPIVRPEDYYNGNGDYFILE